MAIKPRLPRTSKRSVKVDLPLLEEGEFRVMDAFGKVAATGYRDEAPDGTPRIVVESLLDLDMFLRWVFR